MLQHSIARGCARADRLGITGGILMGVMLSQHPGLFKELCRAPSESEVRRFAPGAMRRSANVCNGWIELAD